MADTLQMAEDSLRKYFDRYLGKTEVAIYSTLALLLTITVLAGIASASKLLWDALTHWSIAAHSMMFQDRFEAGRLLAFQTEPSSEPA
jgi:hypothetical protein